MSSKIILIVLLGIFAQQGVKCELLSQRDVRLFGVAEDIIQRVVATVQDLVDRVLQILRRVLDVVQSTIQTTLQQVQVIFSSIIENVDDLVEDILGKLLQTVDEILNARPCIDQKRDEARQAAQKGLTETLNSIQSLGANVTQELDEIRQNLLSEASQLNLLILQTLDNFRECIASGKLFTCLGGALEGVKSGAAEIASIVRSQLVAVQDLSTVITTGARNIVAEALSSATDIRQTLSAGIKQCVVDVGNSTVGGLIPSTIIPDLL